ncbi:LysR substrate-binding domain-containing protein [Ruegeria sp. WL0004]|uniref:LysR substrate-binding domain-containing protein n=1 Tax=Ruegeria marisflavi TaxID=2984152 RepID=A0ABT2WWU9_9RHOB|nr:LysR substrate-binding domain-containing protein [Ruegeria sp. WL0004]MCU9840378.1 LysR substrate-binding domain-containing protein [Ruegeria sp. WL0004]
MRFDLFSLEIFVTVAELGSIVRAAARHNIAASAASKRLSDLERVVGAPLLYRQRRGVSLTSAGEELLNHARSIGRMVERMESEMGNHAEGIRGTIRVAANTSSITQFLPEDLAAFAKENPDLQIQLVEETSSDILDTVRSGAADLGIYSGFTDAKGVQSLLYRRDTLVIAAPRDHDLAALKSVKFSDVLNQDFVALQQGSSIKNYLERKAQSLGASFKTRVEVMSFDGVRRMVQAKLGIAILPLGAVEPYLENSELAMIPIDEPWARRELRIAMRDRATLTVQAQLLLRFLAPHDP